MENIIYIVLTNYYKHGYYGAYSTLEHAREAVNSFLNDKNGWVTDVQNFTALPDYHTFKMTTAASKEKDYWIQILPDWIDR